jgi:hypothetical protein
METGSIEYALSSTHNPEVTSDGVALKNYLLLNIRVTWISIVKTGLKFFIKFATF